jgi:hypothetical protein
MHAGGAVSSQLRVGSVAALRCCVASQDEVQLVHKVTRRHDVHLQPAAGETAGSEHFEHQQIACTQLGLRAELKKPTPKEAP